MDPLAAYDLFVKNYKHAIVVALVWALYSKVERLEDKLHDCYMENRSVSFGPEQRDKLKQRSFIAAVLPCEPVGNVKKRRRDEEVNS